MIRPEDQRAIEDLFERLRNVERNSGPRDAEAEELIRAELQRNPAAAYFMAQTIIVQEAALREQQARLEEQKNEGNRGGFLGGIFGGDDNRRQPETQRYQPAPERPSGPWGRGNAGGGGFLAGAAQTALGVTGGVLLGSAIAGMFSTPAEAAEQPVDEDAGTDAAADDAGGDWGGDGDFDMGGDF
jgi:hypothetical protein